MANCRTLIVATLATCALTGCSREWYREQADENVAELIEEKTYNRWESPWTGIDMDPRSRFYDPYDPVRPPMPPDDPDSHRYMHQVDVHQGWAHWHDSGNIDALENPGWFEGLLSEERRAEDGSIILTLEDVIRLSRVNSSDYQQQLETLYLSAIDVSTERFRLQTQFAGGAGAGSGGRTFFNDTGLSLDGDDITSGGRFDVNTTTDIQLRRRLATAGEFIVNFANEFMWELSGPDAGSVSSTMGFVFLQPLLRAGGRQIALEILTVAERTLLANIRSFEHYRQGYFAQITIGDNGSATRPSRRGGFQGGSGLSGFSGQGSGGFGGVGDATGFGRSGGGNGGGGGGGVTGAGFVGGGAGTVGGFLGILQQTQQLRNTETSLAAQLQTLNLLEAHLEGGLIDLAQVDQFRQSIETERANLLRSRNDLQNTVEGFSTFTLGVPPDTRIQLDDSRLAEFRFVSATLQQRQDELQTIVTQLGGLGENVTAEQIAEILSKLNKLIESVAEEIERITADVARVDEVRERRLTSMSEYEKRTFEKDLVTLKENLEALKESFEMVSQKVGMLIDDPGENLDETAGEIVTVNVELSNILGELALIQTRARAEVIILNPIRLDPKVALEIARANRLDWMNIRASLVDSWRLIEFNANRLESNLDIVMSGNINTKGDNPLDFSGESTRLRAGIRFDAPFNRLVERNDFRQQLIFYQQSRRGIIQYEDGVNRSLRSILRELDYLERNLEIQRRAVAIAIRRVDQTRENLNRPTPPAQPGAPVAQFGPTAAINLLTALSDLRSSQNAFMSVWVNYYSTRLRLFQDLGVMRIDRNGLWIEESLDEALRASAEDHPLPPGVPQQWLDATEPEDGEDESAPSGEEGPAPEEVPAPSAAAIPVRSVRFDRVRRTAPPGSPGRGVRTFAEHESEAEPPRILPVDFSQRPNRATLAPVQPAHREERKPTGWRKSQKAD